MSNFLRCLQWTNSRFRFILYYFIIFACLESVLGRKWANWKQPPGGHANFRCYCRAHWCVCMCVYVAIKRRQIATLIRSLLALQSAARNGVFLSPFISFIFCKESRIIAPLNRIPMGGGGWLPKHPPIISGLWGEALEEFYCICFFIEFFCSKKNKSKRR